MKLRNAKKAVGAIGMLISLLIISIVFILMMPAIKDFGGGSIGTNSVNNKNLEQKIDEQVNEIMKIRQQQAEQLNH